MKTVSRGIVSIIVSVILIVLFSATVSAEDEVFVVSADQNGDANYMVSNGDGTFSNGDGTSPVQENLMLMDDSGLHPMSESWLDVFHYSFGNGVGDFDNDDQYDYIMGDGIFGMTTNIYFFKKIVDGNQFASPVAVAEWSIGYYPMDMAVADFNGDGNLDFVMSYYGSPNCGLYLGDGAPAPDYTLGFTDSLLENTAPNISAGADAADFDNDGDVDFVIAPMSPGEPFFVNLNDGEASFTTHTFEGLKDDANGDYVAYYGVAAADFVDSDGNMDIAAATDGYLDIFKGNGDGTFVWEASYKYDLNSNSPLDNYDFDGDGNQDLVAANFGLDGADVAILLSKDDGTFGDPAVIYGGGTSGVRHAVSAPPSPIAIGSNIKPVAVVDPIHMEVTVGEEIVFDGSESYDDDGEIVKYAWDFGDGTVIEGSSSYVDNGRIVKYARDTGDGAVIDRGLTASSLPATGAGNHEVAPSHSYYDVGKYTVTLKVTDDKGATASVQAEVNALPVMARVRFKPSTLYLNSRAKWIWATIRLPYGFDARRIDDPSVCLVLEDGSRLYAYSNYGRGFFAKLRKRFYRKRRALTVRFDRQRLIDLIQETKIPSGIKTLMVQGVVLDNGAWVGFEGSGQIRTIEKKKKHNYWRKYWKRCFKRFSNKYRSNYRR